LRKPAHRITVTTSVSPKKETVLREIFRYFCYRYSFCLHESRPSVLTVYQLRAYFFPYVLQVWRSDYTQRRIEAESKCNGELVEVVSEWVKINEEVAETKRVSLHHFLNFAR
jgi:hypothetical protein